MHSLLLAFVLSLWAMPLAAQQALVLGGGGSRGLAHAGAITGLETRGWDPDLVVGTSIGAIVGALYATGLSADSVWKVAASRDWRELFFFAPNVIAPGTPHVYPMFQLGLMVDRSRYSDGLIADVRVNRLLTHSFFDAASRARGDFDRLPRAFRAVAADLATGEAITLECGDLARSVRASMAVPGVFAPILHNGRTLVDGGIADYLPVGVAEERGYDDVVAVDVVRPPPSIHGLNPMQAAIRAFRLMLDNAREGEADADVLVLPAISPERTAAFFPSDPTALLELGRNAALEQAPQVDRERTPRRIGPQPQRIDRLRIDVVDSSMHDMIRHAFASAVGPYDANRILRAMDALYATSQFNGIWPHLEFGPDGEVTLVVQADAVTPLTVAAAGNYENDRGGRIWATLRWRPAGGPVESVLTLAHEQLRAFAGLRLRRPLQFAPDFSIAADAFFQESDVRVFNGENRAVEHDVSRTGATVGIDWQRLDPDWNAALVFFAEQVRTPERRAESFGPRLRVERTLEPWRVTGLSPLLELEARFGGFEYQRLRARASRHADLAHLRVSVLADATVSTSDAPPDAQPALGDEHLMPGLAWGQHRAPVRLVTGIDLAHPTLFDVIARARFRTGAIASAFDDLVSTRFLPGADIGLIWWSPLGRIEANLGVARSERRRLDFAVGMPF